MKGKVEKAGEKMNTFLNGLFGEGFAEKASAMNGLFSSWEDIAKEAGLENTVPHSHIANHKKGVILIEADHPGWVQILQTKQKDILEIFMKKFPEIDIESVLIKLQREKK